MLKNIPPILSPDLLHILMSMGHGDEIVIADGNFPADTHAERLIRADGHGVCDIVKAFIPFFPMDESVNDYAIVMATGNESIPPIWTEFESILHNQSPNRSTLTSISREAFYERSRNAFAIVATSESALFANIILKKGVVLN
ncbi:MAG: fucose isomerase [Candidatus Marinimicrobia bacterium]|nr:fucose isomerase [Candidatus Neomarinimicrobiota bacterium]